ncbi:inorganic pyrophosphatase [Thraustotheca clavata]|uniref:inorganic diphosphatase n=1 Tax=Thraustotheca clavata TaxID=74557 RepID=A0A1V9Y7L8_9STRA|nr:inorganic pyrophosphatase [Thraustotheca clavata]
MSSEGFESFIAQAAAVSGYLYNQTEKNSLIWKRRYCVLHDTAIFYYESEEAHAEGSLKGKILFNSVHDWDGKPHGFQFYTPTNKCFRVYTDSDEERNKWMQAMQEQLNNAPDIADGEFAPYARHGASSPSGSPRAAPVYRTLRSDSWRGEDVDVSNMLTELEDLRSQVETLRSELVVYEKTEKRGEVRSRGTRQRRGSVLEDGTPIALEPREMERMKQIFSLFDSNGNGSINASDLQKLHARLGEPITDIEAQEALDYMNPVDGSVNFVSFMKWWNEDHKNENPSEAMQRYQAKFKFLKARIANPAIGNIETEMTGPCPSFEFRVNFVYHHRDGSKVRISPWHDIPLYNADGSVNFVCEIPKWSRKKFEIATGEPFNPIKQDTKNGKLREYGWGDMMFNYGALPQTWEDPNHITEGTGCGGDNDPLDVIEIGTKKWNVGSIVQVKVLGVLALIDDNETDWKVLCINVEDHYASKIHDVADIEAHMPGCISAIHDWLRDYKLPNINQFAYEGKCMNRDFAESVVAETHEFWKLLVEERGGQAMV